MHVLDPKKLGASGSMPDPEGDCPFFIRTKNGQGFMGAYPSDPYMKAFIAFASNAPGPLLDVGAAYGVASIPALESGAHVIANDTDPTHLEILYQRASADLRSRLTLIAGAFPNQLNFESDFLGGVLICRVLHFFDGPLLEKSAGKLFSWLKPGGKVFVTAETPYLKNIQSFLKVYEERVAQGQRWPGFIDNFPKFDSRGGYNLPQTMHFLDPVILRRTFTEAGFRVERAEIFGRPEFPDSIKLDGRESVGLIAIKP